MFCEGAAVPVDAESDSVTGATDCPSLVAGAVWAGAKVVVLAGGSTDWPGVLTGCWARLLSLGFRDTGVPGKVGGCAVPVLGAPSVSTRGVL